MDSLNARCLMCGKSYQLSGGDKDFKKLNDKKLSDPKQAMVTFICDLCSNKVRFESDELRKPKKPV